MRPATTTLHRRASALCGTARNAGLDVTSGDYMLDPDVDDLHGGDEALAGPNDHLDCTGDTPGPDHVIDLYLPPGVEPASVIVLAHGGTRAERTPTVVGREGLEVRARTLFPPEATSSANAVNVQVKTSVRCRIRVDVIGNAAPGPSGEPAWSRLRSNSPRPACTFRAPDAVRSDDVYAGHRPTRSTTRPERAESGRPGCRRSRSTSTGPAVAANSTGRGQPPPPWTSTIRYSPISKASVLVALSTVDPETPVLDCQVTVQFEVATIGHFPVPPVRSFADIHVYLCPHGGSAFQS